MLREYQMRVSFVVITIGTCILLWFFSRGNLKNKWTTSLSLDVDNTFQSSLYVDQRFDERVKASERGPIAKDNSTLRGGLYNGNSVSSNDTNIRDKAGINPNENFPNIMMDKYERFVFDDGRDIEGYLEFYNISEFYASASEGDRFVELEYDDARTICKKRPFLFPHVPKTGGRTLAYTFNDDPEYQGPKFSLFRSLLNETNSSNSTTEFITTRQHHDIPHMTHRIVKHRRKIGADTLGNRSKDLQKIDFFLRKCSTKPIDPVDLVSCGRISTGGCSAWIFLMREPISRLVSAYHATLGRNTHFQCKKGSKEYQSVINLNGTLEDWLTLPLDSRKDNCKIFNRQTKFLAYDYLNKSPKQLLMMAKTRLMQMDWFGLTSRFEESVAMLSHLLKLDLMRYQPIFNYNPHPAKISNELRESLSDGQEVDILLYRLAEKLFDYRWMILQQKLGQRKESQIFKCDEKVFCVTPQFDATWWMGDDTPDLYKHATVHAQKLSLCVPPKGCTRKEFW